MVYVVADAFACYEPSLVTAGLKERSLRDTCYSGTKKGRSVDLL